MWKEWKVFAQKTYDLVTNQFNKKMNYNWETIHIYLIKLSPPNLKSNNYFPHAMSQKSS